MLKRCFYLLEYLIFLVNIFLISKLSSQATDNKGGLFLGVRSKITTGCLLINVISKFLLSKEVENKAVMHIFMYQKMLIIC